MFKKYAGILLLFLCFSGIELQDYGCEVMFPKINIIPTDHEDVHDFNSLDRNTQQQLLDIINQDTFSK